MNLLTEIKYEYQLIRDIEQLYKGKDGLDKLLANAKRSLRAKIKEQKSDPIAFPITIKTRSLVLNDVEGEIAEYGIFKFHLSKQEREQFVEQNEIRINSMYDCTGKRFTTSLSVKDIPIGTSYIHHTAIDF